MSEMTHEDRRTELRDEIAAIKAQLAAADLERQQTGRPIDPRWFHRARTALRHKRREAAALERRKDTDKDRFKDTLIAVLREATPEAAWALFLAQARRRFGTEDANMEEERQW